MNNWIKYFANELEKNAGIGQAFGKLMGPAMNGLIVASTMGDIKSKLKASRFAPLRQNEEKWQLPSYTPKPDAP